MIHQFILSQCENRKQKLVHGQKASNINCSTVVFMFEFCRISLPVSLTVVKFVFTRSLYEGLNILSLRRQSNLLWEKCLIKAYGANKIYCHLLWFRIPLSCCLSPCPSVEAPCERYPFAKLNLSKIYICRILDSVRNVYYSLSFWLI